MKRPGRGTYADSRVPVGVGRKKAIENLQTPSAHEKIEVVFADHPEPSPEFGSNIVRQWFDVNKVEVVSNVPNLVGGARRQQPSPRKRTKVFACLSAPQRPI